MAQTAQRTIPAHQASSVLYPASFTTISFTDTVQPVAHREVFSVYAQDQLLEAKNSLCFRSIMAVKDVDLTIHREKDDIVLTFQAAGRETVEIKINATKFLAASVDPKATKSGSPDYSDAGNIVRRAADTRGISMSAKTANNLANVLHFRYG
jgi:hypothetical protein